MDSVNLEVLRQAVAWSEAGVPVTLATVVRTWGSSPRPEGALLAIAGDGRLVGSVSGGCIEDDLLDRLRTERPSRPEHVTYGITADQTRRFGLPCGGKLELVLEPVARGNRLADTLAAIERGEMVARRLDLASGAVDLLGDVPNNAVQFDGRTLVAAFGPRWRMLIIGAGQLSRYLAEFALALDYQVTICEPREEYRESWTVPGATLTTEMPDDAVTALRPDRRTVIIGATHDPKLDDLALIDALRTNAFYVGAIGSRANSERRRERLKLFDLSDADVDRLHGPVGLPLGSRTPPEIALAILADITARRNGVTLIAAEARPESVGDACPAL
ncbi:MAG: XdhC family protein [Pseudomonas sp.]|nr:XdhC family protein [Pseudomonas sp.]